ncbi:MAG: HAMP domain-containing sensor histidine kinase [Bacillota bacterium]|nr:HAMP domain-containing sensor histidine kinase [Bacillota bacterium]
MENEEAKKHQKKPGTGINTFLHVLQQAVIFIAAILAVMVLCGSYVVIESGNGTQLYNIRNEEADTKFEDSKLFNKLLGNSITDVVRYGAIRGQMETDGEFDGKKVIDTTAFAGRYNSLQSEYITARYYLDDLINWSKNGFTYEDVYMTGEEADQFLSRFNLVTTVDLDSDSYSGSAKYLNSDLDSAVVIKDVSGNLFDTGAYQREDENVTVLRNRYRTVDGKNIEDHVAIFDEYYKLCANIKQTADDLALNYNEYLKYQELYQPGQSNVVYFIRKTVGDDVLVYTNLDTKAKNLTVLKQELLDSCMRSVYYDPVNMTYETDTQIEESTLRYVMNGFDYAYPENTQVMVGIRSDLSYAQDGFNKARNEFNKYVPFLGQYLVCAVVCIIIYLLLLALLTVREGVAGRKESGEVIIRLHREDRIPTEIMIAAAGMIVFLVYMLISRVINTAWQSMGNNAMIAFGAVFVLAVSLLFSFFYYSFVRRIKAGTLWRDSLIRRFGKWVLKWIRYAYRHWDLVLRVWVPFGIFVLFHMVMLLVISAGSLYSVPRFLIAMLILIVVDIQIGILIYRSARARQTILEGIRKISEGDTEYKVNEKGMQGDNLVMARAVNSIGDSVKNAVETSMKDERLKADLITNVSHDIKTPLTSIINYVDLIKRQNVQDPQIREYIQVLDAKSQRLKQLTDDLVEASKISSGNIVLQWEKINLVELLHQTIGEFSEKFGEKRLYPVFNSPADNVCILADSRRIWRVMENLFNNIYKYALEGTRVYIDLELRQDAENHEKWVVLAVKNISAKPLKVNPNELTERFIRGDESRTTEGSGLGLSIAKNLVEIQKGVLEIVMDGDLFKVNLYFPLLEEQIN